jgi:hypothetical protein
MIKIQFTKHFQNYEKGKVISFNDETSQGLINFGVAKLYEDKKEKIQYENKMDNLTVENK